MKQLIGVTLLLGLCVFFSACVPMLADDCEFLGTCSCDDPNFGPSHRDLCPLDAGDAGNSILLDGNGAEAGDALVDAGRGSGDDSAPAPSDASDANGDRGIDASVADGLGIESSTDLQDAAPAEAEAEAAICDPTSLPSVSLCVIDEQYGVFVSPLGNDVVGVGTRDAPLRTIGAGLVRARGAGKRVYACDNGTGYVESITVNAGFERVALFGGFACVDWSYSTARRAVVRAPSGSALVVRGVSGVLLENFELDAADATGPGSSSIGAIVDTAMGVVMRRVRIAGGAGAAGADGVDGIAGSAGPMADAPQRGLAATCGPNSGGQLGGSWAAMSMCGSRGGNGGSSSTSGAGSAPGFLGTPQDGVNPPGVNNRGLENMPGLAGSAGNAGMPGVPASGMGTFSSAGYMPAGSAASGTTGFVGQGGGGGGSSDVPAQLVNCLGASGGAGGMGGCGGAPGSGGVGGGASAALLIWMSQVTLDTCDLSAGVGGAGGNGGNGGPGGTGQPGAMGGAGLTNGSSTIAASGQGGPGGRGGAGGPGAGGNGGPSYALVFSGPPPTRTATTLVVVRGGAAGAGGTAPVAGMDGGLLFAPAGTTGLASMEFAVP